MLVTRDEEFGVKLHIECAWQTCAVRALVVAGLLGLAACGGTPRTPLTPVAVQPVVLISLDGFRWDYLDRPEAARLRELAARGVRAERLVPSFPSKTFPNHYTLVTGLYPEHHGIAANVMLDSTLGRFQTGNHPSVRDARWFGGEPIWVTAKKQGVRTATYFWPGSEAPIGGIYPHWYYRFDAVTARDTRVRRVLEWLAMPDSSRPRLVAVYFSDVDTDGHTHGPDSPEVNAAIARVDSAVGAIIDGIAQQGKTSQVNVVVVADHGMAAVSADRVIALDDYVAMDSLAVADWTPVATIIPKPGREAYVYRALRGANAHLQVYRKGELPPHLHYNSGARVTPIVAIADEGWSIGTRAMLATMKRGVITGAHGYDNTLPSMGALFVAAGPSFRRGVTVPAFTNVHVYPLLAQLLRLTPAITDGSLDSVRALLR
jgi:predicted AlkP superfamily pyrophosphatase or phosphodiesterase